MYIDTHAHLDDKAFAQDLKQVMQKIDAAGIDRVINCACDAASMKSSLKLSKDYAKIYAALGYHPHNVKGLDYDAVDLLYDRVDGQEKCVAIGEIGLDYHYNFAPHDEQQEWFVEQIELAKELALPIIVHSREATEDTLRILAESDAGYVGGVIHAFSGAPELAREYMDMGFYIGIGGFSTFQDAKKLQRTIAEIPPERMLLETDCPYLTPAPHRGERNDSSYIPLIAEHIAKVRGITAEEVARITTANAMKLFWEA